MTLERGQGQVIIPYLTVKEVNLSCDPKEKDS